MAKPKAPLNLPNIPDEILSEETPRTRRPKKMRTINERIRDHEAHLEYLRRRAVLEELKTSTGGRQIDALLKAKKAVTEVGEDKIADDIEAAIQRMADEHEIDLP